MRTLIRLWAWAPLRVPKGVGCQCGERLSLFAVSGVSEDPPLAFYELAAYWTTIYEKIVEVGTETLPPDGEEIPV